MPRTMLAIHIAAKAVKAGGVSTMQTAKTSFFPLHCLLLALPLQLKINVYINICH